MDIKNLATADFAVLELKDPSTGLKSDATITLYSHLSKEFNKARKEVMKLTSLDETFFQIELLVKITKEIKGFTENGEPLESNEENIRKIYQSNYTRDQADMFISSISNFFLKA